jgi:aspartyl-tRNA(Asn)/glutamyl-tRNA(Gln) amidotransferase subunit A
MSELDYLTIAGAAKLIMRRRLSPVELIGHALARIEAIDPKLNAFIEVLAEHALAEARKAEAEIAAGRYRGPLHGIPYGLKDLIDVAGVRTTCHSKIMADNTAAADAAVVERLRNAGAIVIGKLALHEFGSGGPTLELPWPPARNPWNADFHPGGSSSGSAAAVAAGMIAAALGTDTGGSIRNPATCCGIVGMKPTYGLVSRRGVMPLSFSLDHIGPMTRTVEDNALLLQCIAGFDSRDISSRRAQPIDFNKDLHKGIKGLRIGVIEHFYTEDAEADSEMRDGIGRAVARLRELGAVVEPVRLPPLAQWNACGRAILQAEAYVVHETWLKQRPQDYCEISRRKLMAGAFIRAEEYIKALQARTTLSAQFNALMQSYDAVVTLSGLELPCRIDDADAIARTYERHLRMPFNITGTPAIAVPTGRSASGLPLGMQIAGKAFDEATVYRIAAAYCEAAEITLRPTLPWPERTERARTN